jgi:tetratricopeptide (TPR) repeat protein
LLVFDNLTSSIYFFAILAFVHGMSRRELPAKLWLSKPAGEHAIAVVAPLVVIVIAVGGWALNAPGMARASTLVGALNSAQGQDPSATLKVYEQSLSAGAWPGNPLGYQEAVEQFMTYAGNVAGSSAAADVKNKYFTESVDAEKKLSAVRKNDARIELFVSGFYSQFGQLPEALAHAKRALELSPGKQQILFQLGLTYLNSGDKAQALATFKKAYDEAPENDQALVYYALGQYFAGNMVAGDQLVVSRFGTTTVDNAQLLQAYTQLKLFGRVIAVWQLRVNENPKDFNTNLGLASAYYAAGDKAATIAQLKKMQQLDPSKAGQLQQLIDQLNAITSVQTKK